MHLFLPCVPRHITIEDSTASLETESVKLQENEGKDAENKIEEEDKEADTAKGADENAISSEGGKKDPFLRRQELLINSGLAESVINTCIVSAGELLRSNFGKEVIYELVTGGSDGILQPSLNDKLMALNEAIASVAAKPKSEEADGEHVLENFHSSRTIRKMILDSPSFASTLWNGALQGSFKIWAKGHSAKVITAFLESSNQLVREMVRENLQPLLDDGTLKLTESK